MGRAADNVAHVERLWRAMQVEGVEAVIALTAPDVLWRPFGAGGRTLRGHEELRAYFGELDRLGVGQDAHAYAFEPVGEHAVLVSGTLRSQSANGLADRQLFWLYRLRADGTLAAAESFTTRAAALTAARES